MLEDVQVLKVVSSTSVPRDRLGEAVVTGRVSLRARFGAQGPASHRMARVTTYPSVPRICLVYPCCPGVIITFTLKSVRVWTVNCMVAVGTGTEKCCFYQVAIKGV